MRRAALVMSMALLASPAEAQLAGEGDPKSSATGFMVSASGQVGRFQFDDARTGQNGSGVTAMLGYGFTHTYALVVTGSSAQFDYDGGSYVADQLALGVRIHMANAQWQWLPYLELAAGSRRIVDPGYTICSFLECQQGELRRSGVVYAQAVGVSFYPVRRLALTLAGHVNVGPMKATFDGRELFGREGSAQDLRLSLGGTWIVGGGRR